MHADLITNLHFDHRTTFSGAVAQVLHLSIRQLMFLYLGLYEFFTIISHPSNNYHGRLLVIIAFFHIICYDV